jgi:hypothetical protein
MMRLLAWVVLREAVHVLESWDDGDNTGPTRESEYKLGRRRDHHGRWGSK